MAAVEILDGEIFRDARGQISSLNDFRFRGIERVYFIHHPDVSVIRGWHAHKKERKWFYCVKGAFTLKLVEIDNWENPSPDLNVQTYHLTEQKSRIVCVPPGYANWLKAGIADSVLMVFSSNILENAKNDSWRFDSSMWLSNEER